MATVQSIRSVDRMLTEIPNASVTAVNAAVALQLAIRGMEVIATQGDADKPAFEALGWLAKFTLDATEATMALANDMPARWRVFAEELETAQAVDAIAIQERKEVHG